MKKYKSLVSMCALAALANCAKADIISAQEHFDEEENMKSIVVNNPTASIGPMKTPWMFVRPDGNSGFANDFTTNAISVVSEDGVNYYAHVKGENNDRTKVIHFTIDKNGIPSKHGDVIDTIDSGEENNFEEMKKRKLVGVAHGYLCFYPTEEYGTSLIYNPDTKKVCPDEVKNITQKCLASCQDESRVHVLCNLKYTDYFNDGEIRTTTMVKGITGLPYSMIEYEQFFPTPFSDENRVMSYHSYKKNRCYIGDSEGNVMVDGEVLQGLKLPGRVSSITESDNMVDVFVTSTATNAFCNVGFEDMGGKHYNIVSEDGRGFGNGKSMVPKTNEGLIRIIDRRPKGGKLMYVTPKGIHTIDD